jgi:hypothetical protein
MSQSSGMTNLKGSRLSCDRTRSRRALASAGAIGFYLQTPAGSAMICLGVSDDEIMSSRHALTLPGFMQFVRSVSYAQ